MTTYTDYNVVLGVSSAGRQKETGLPNPSQQLSLSMYVWNMRPKSSDLYRFMHGDVTVNFSAMTCSYIFP